MPAPKCKLCGAVHWGEAHVYKGERVTKLPAGVTRGVTSVTKSVTRPVDVTPAVTDHECPVCGLMHHRPATNAERVRAYRSRHGLPDMVDGASQPDA